MADTMRRIDLVVVKDEPSRNTKGAGKRIAVVQWIKDDKQTAIQWGKFEYWINENDRQEHVKIKCLNLEETQFVFAGGAASVWSTKMLPVLKNPPPVKPLVAPKADTSGASDSQVEEVPF